MMELVSTIVMPDLSSGAGSNGSYYRTVVILLNI
jgi:hypothetical protein